MKDVEREETHHPHPLHEERDQAGKPRDPQSMKHLEAPEALHPVGRNVVDTAEQAYPTEPKHHGRDAAVKDVPQTESRPQPEQG